MLACSVLIGPVFDNLAELPVQKFWLKGLPTGVFAVVNENLIRRVLLLTTLLAP